MVQSTAGKDKGQRKASVGTEGEQAPAEDRGAEARPGRRRPGSGQRQRLVEGRKLGGASGLSCSFLLSGKEKFKKGVSL